MQFNRSALVAAIDKAIEQERDAISRAKESNATASEAWREEWISLHSENWVKAINTMRAKLRKGQPIREEDIPRDRAGYPGAKAFYRDRNPDRVPTRTVELHGLRAVLTAVADETISSSALRTIGVSVTTLRQIVPLLGTATVHGERPKVAR